MAHSTRADAGVGKEREGLPGQFRGGGGRAGCAARACRVGNHVQSREMRRTSTQKKQRQGAVAAMKAEHLLVHGIVLPSPGLLHVQIAPLLLRKQLVLRA
jgi:hypothetical protein